jgi:hypothetical protein
MDQIKLRAWYSHKQGLDGRLAGREPADVFAETGWARSVGGCGPYLTLLARAGSTRAVADAAVAALEIHELPAARGCTYVLPVSDFALGLKAGESFADNEMKVARKLGVTDKEIDKLCEAVVKALGKETLDPEEIRKRVGTATRSLGEAGKKKGVTTTLPLALGKLQTVGEIRRVPINGRLDQQRYKYKLWRPNPLRGFKLSAEETATELGRKYFTWIGPAKLAEFQVFSGLGVKAARAALEPLKLEPHEDLLWLPGDRAKFDSFKIPKDPQYVLVSVLDGIAILAGESSVGYPSNAILDRGRVVGVWEYDLDTESIAWHVFVQRNKDLQKAVARTEEYVRKELGDARSFSLDSPKSRAPRIQAIRTSTIARKDPA